MTCIEKLSIQGIRSFDTGAASFIEFEKPLTLIVGPNGSGKTTVIECLKYATTGELPPDSSKGQAFVHDPRLVQEKEVKAQVKLLFTTVNGKPIVCSRALQLTQKANTQSLKTLDSVLVTKNAATGQQVSQSMKCADLDKEIPELMGVSKAILTNVIFCHQEESNWPLEESSSIKKRFDAIFASTRYTKALEVIHGQKKDLNVQIREHKLELQLAESRLETAKSMRREVADNEEKMANLEKEMSEISQAIEAAETTESRLLKLKANANNDVNELTRLKQSKAALENDLLGFGPGENGGEFCSESMEELEMQLENFDADLERLKSQRVQADAKKKSLLLRKRDGESELTGLAQKLGQAEAAREHLQTMQRERDARVSEFIQNYKLNPRGDMDLDFHKEEAIRAFFVKVKKLLDAITKRLNDHSQRHRDEEAIKEKELESITMDCLNAKSQVEEAERRRDTARRQLRALSDEIAKKGALFNKLASMQEELVAKKSDLEAMNRDFNQEDEDRKVAQLKDRKSAMEVELQQLRERLRILMQHSEAASRVRFLRNTIAEKKQLARDKRQDSAALLASLAIDDLEQLSLSELLATVAAMCEEIQARNRSDKTAFDSLQQQLSFTSGSFESARESSVARRAKLDKTRREFEEKGLLPASAVSANGSFDPNSFAELVRAVEKKIQQAQEDETRRQSAQIIYSRFIEQTRESHVCPLCEQGLPDEQEFVAHLQARAEEESRAGKPDIEDLASAMEMTTPEKAREALVKLERRRERLRAMQPEWDAMCLESVEVPKLERLVNESRGRMESLQRAVERAEGEASVLQAREKSLKQSLDVITELHQAEEEFSKMNDEASQIESRLPPEFRSGNVQSHEQLSTDISAREKAKEQLEREIGVAYQLVSQRMTAIASCTREVAQLEQTIGQQRTFHADIDALNRQSEEHTRAIESEESRLTELKQRQEQQSAAQEAKRNEMRQSKAQFEGEYKEFVGEKERFMERQNAIISQHEIIERMARDASANAALLEELQARQRQLREQVADDTKSLTQVEQLLTSFAEKLSQGDMRKLAIREKMRFRTCLASLADLEARVESLRRKLEQHGADATQADAQLSVLQRELIVARSKRDKHRGAFNSYRDMIKQKNHELKSKFSDVDKVYQDKLIVLKTSEMAAGDLDKFYSALDKALMKFHAMKMAEINTVLRELWQSTYKGHDIEAIEIRAESEVTNRRSFNYRVVMLKDSVAVDMRGRCSAGQKVLASLIIRLALAETFCANCGILALDEPTTNLDRLNVESFAQSLVGIIDQRKKSRSFQLIIITHDEDFVQTIGRSEHAEYYYRVSKQENDKKQLRSTIDRFKIKDAGDVH